LSTLEQNPAAVAAILVEFSYEDPATVLRYAIWEDDVVFGGDTYSSMPRMNVKLPKIDGTTRTSQATIESEEVPPFDSMRSTFPPVSVRIFELTPGDDTTEYVLYKGEVSECSFNHNGNPNLVQATVSGPTRRLETTTSLRVGRFCPWTFGIDADGPCQYDREGNKETVTVTAISGNSVTLTGSTVLDPSLWKGGSLRFNGFEVTIHWQESLTTVHLIKPAPSHWLNEDVDMLPGCLKTIEDCRTRGQEERFCGLGVNLPLKDIRISEA
jgi:hypothetical protein